MSSNPEELLKKGRVYYLCNEQRTSELSKRMYERNVPYAPLQPAYDPRPVETRHVVLPVLDCYKPAKEICDVYPVFNQRLNFSPGKAPFSGYANEIDAESQLKNIIMPLQDCARSKYIPSSSSDLYDNTYLAQTTRPVKMTNNLLFKQDKLQPFNPNPCGLGFKRFNNHTRQQTKNLS
jgi:hypothetical protein